MFLFVVFFLSISFLFLFSFLSPSLFFFPPFFPLSLFFTLFDRWSRWSWRGCEMDSWGNGTLWKEERKQRKKEGERKKQRGREEEMIRPMENVDEKEEGNKRYRFGSVWREVSEKEITEKSETNVNKWFRSSENEDTCFLFNLFCWEKEERRGIKNGMKWRWEENRLNCNYAHE